MTDLPSGEVPVFNCHVYVAKTSDGRHAARASQLRQLSAQADSEREVLQTMVTQFKQYVAEYVERDEPIPWLETPLEKKPDETERWIAVHL